MRRHLHGGNRGARLRLALVCAGVLGLVLAAGAAGDGPLPFALANAGGSPIQLTASPNSIQLADLNGDGKLDFVTSLVSDPNGSIVAYKGLGGGKFTAFGSPVPTAGDFPTSFIGNVNTDKFPDVVSVDENGNEVDVYVNDGHGNFTEHGSSFHTCPPYGVSYPNDVEFGDFNADGKPDMIVSCAYPNSTDRVYLGDGSGGFTAGAVYTVGGDTAAQPSNLVVGDFNGDKKLDFITEMEYANSQPNSVALAEYFGNGDGTFALQPLIPLPGYDLGWMYSGDMNGDKKADLMLLGFGQDQGVVTLLGNGKGGFGAPILSPGPQLSDARFAKINGDTKLDFYGADEGGGEQGIVVAVGTGNGSFAFEPTRFKPTNVTEDNPEPYWLATGDLNGDGHPDVVATDVGSNASVQVDTVWSMLWSTKALAAPSATQIDHKVALPGASVTLTGKNLLNVAGVGFGGVLGAITARSSTSLTVTVPGGAKYGKLVLYYDGGSVTTAITFAPIYAPLVTSLSPKGGQKAGKTVTITGKYLSGVDTVTLDSGQALTNLKVTETTVTGVIPLAVPEGNYDDLTLHDAAGSAMESYAVEAAAPKITTFNPLDGAANTQVRQVVTIHGSHLFGITSVLFNGKAGTDIVLGDGTSITAKPPLGATSGKITVTNMLGSAVSLTKFVIDPLPTLTNLSVLTGKEGDPVTITGKNLMSATAVTFGGVEQDTITPSDDGTTITTTIPTGAQIGAVIVETPHGNATSTQTFTPILVPEVDSIAPANQALKGALLTLTGHNFTTATGVTIGGAAATFEIGSDTQITATVPSGSTGGAVQVTVTDPAGSGHKSYTVLVPPTITSFPAAAFSGATISIVGDFFDGTSKVEINGENADFTFVDSQHLSVTLPYDATPGAIAVTNPAGKTTSAAQFDAVRILSLAFSESNLAPNDTITVGGTGLSGLTSLVLTGAAGPISPNAGGTDTQVVFKMPSCAQSGTWFLYVGTFEYNAGTLTYTGPACS